MNGPRRAIVAFVAALLVVGPSTALIAPAAFADDKTPGIGITVTVSPAPAPAPAPAPDAAGSGSGSPADGAYGSGRPANGSSGPAGTGGGTVVTGGPGGAVAIPSADEFDLGGIVFVSGVTTGYTWNLNPLGGEAHAEFRVHNVSQYTIDSTAGFQLVNPFGGEIARVDGIRIDQMKPDESRVIDATLTGVGQWAFLTTHATFRPPETVGGTALSSLTRDGFQFVLPWFLLVLLALSVGVYAMIAIIPGVGARALAVDAAAPAPTARAGSAV